MGGRIYDASLGRVLQADPFVQEPTSSQSFNRYTYVFNNPLSYTDPSGFITLRQVIGIAVGIALAYFLGPLATKLWHAMLVGFVSGFVSGAIITGNLKSALKSGLIGAAVAGVMFQVTGGPAEAGDPKSADAGGVKDTVNNNGFEGANAPISESSTATTEAVETVAEQGGSSSAQSIGQNVDSGVETMSNIKVTGVAPSSQLSWLDKISYYFDRFFQSFGAKAFRVSLGSGVVAGIRYEMFTNVDKSQLRWQERLKYDPYLYYGIQAASIGSGVMAISKLALKAAKNGIRSGYQYAKGKASQLFRTKPNKGTSVIGPRATYREFAKENGAQFLDVSDDAWTWAKNEKFLSEVVSRGDDVVFAGKFNPLKLDPNSVLAREIGYLTKHGYQWNRDFTKLVKH